MKNCGWPAVAGRLAVAASLAALAVAPGCAADIGLGTRMSPTSAALVEQGGAGSATAGEEFVLVPRMPGEKADSVRGKTPLTNADPFAPAEGGDGAGLGSGNQGAPMSGDNQVGSGDAETARGSCSAAQTAPSGLYLAGDRVLLAGAGGVFAYSSGSWTAVSDAFPCGTVPNAISAASGSLYAAAADGIYRLGPGMTAWSRVVLTGSVVDLDITPDATAGMAVEETGRPWRFDGQAWASQSVRLAPLMGSIRALSATESYAVGLNVLPVVGKWDGQAWATLDQPSGNDPVAGLAVRRTGTIALVATTRTGLWRLGSSGWVAELGPKSSYYLGIPSFNGDIGFVADLGASGGRAFSYQSATWQEAAAAPEPLETVVALPGGGAMALAADGETLYTLAGGAWNRLAAPGNAP